jgi:hypothetical protein
MGRPILLICDNNPSGLHRLTGEPAPVTPRDSDRSSLVDVVDSLRSPPTRPWTVTALAVFFASGAVVSFTTLIALAIPGGALEAIWRLNPRAREPFVSTEGWGLLLMAAVAVTCAAAAIGLWRGNRLGYVLGLTLLTGSLLGDLANASAGLEPRAWVGVPIAALLVTVLATGRARAFFSRGPAQPSARRAE